MYPPLSPKQYATIGVSAREAESLPEVRHGKRAWEAEGPQQEASHHADRPGPEPF